MRILSAAVSLALLLPPHLGCTGASTDASPVADELPPIAGDLVGQVGLRPEDAAAAGLLLASPRIGIRTAIDLQLLAEAPGWLVDELLSELKADGMSIGDRAKVHQLLRAATPMTATLARLPLGRKLQETNADGISADTMAIVLSVLVGAMGYLVQAYTARRAERSSEAQAQEFQVAERRRQREHEQMLAQIKRVDRWLDECCRPISLTLGEILIGRLNFVSASVVELEASAPELFATMLEQAGRVMYAISADGTQGRSTRSGTVYWDAANFPTDQLTRTHGSHYGAFDRAACYAISVADVTHIIFMSCYSRELPDVIIDAIAADPAAPLAQRFRLYVKHGLLPCMELVSQLLQAHAAVVELPPTEWLQHKFSEEFWGQATSDTFRTTWLARTRGWKSLVAEWDSGTLAATLPMAGMANFPYGGLVATNKCVHKHRHYAPQDGFSDTISRYAHDAHKLGDSTRRGYAKILDWHHGSKYACDS